MGEPSTQVDVWVEVTPASNAGGPADAPGANDPSGALPITGGEALMVAVPALALLLARHVVTAARRRLAVGEAT